MLIENFRLLDFFFFFFAIVIRILQKYIFFNHKTDCLKISIYILKYIYLSKVILHSIFLNNMILQNECKKMSQVSPKTFLLFSLFTAFKY